MFMFSVYINNKKELLLPARLVAFKSKILYLIYTYTYLYVTSG